MARCKIKEITEYLILFEDGTTITYDHEQSCCEHNWADFEQLDDIARNCMFDTDALIFEAVDGAGFRFGNTNNLFFVPCYSDQNGYYTDYINIYLNGEEQLSFDCEERTDWCSYW